MNMYKKKISSLIMCLGLFGQSQINASSSNSVSLNESGIASFGRRVAHYANYGLVGAAVALGSYFTYKSVTSPNDPFIILNDAKVVATAGVAAGGLFGYVRRGQVGRYEQALAAQQNLQVLERELPVLREKAQTTEVITSKLAELQKTARQDAQKHQQALEQAASLANSLRHELAEVKESVAIAFDHQRAHFFVGTMGLKAQVTQLEVGLATLKAVSPGNPTIVSSESSLDQLKEVVGAVDRLGQRGVLPALDIALFSVK